MNFSSQFFSVVMVFNVCAQAASEKQVRTCHLSGWYETDKEKLQEQLLQCETDAAHFYSAGLEEVRAVIVPHAGYKYSGSLSAAGLRLFDKKKIKRIILLAPCHSWVTAQAKAFVTDELHYDLPLGSLALDNKAATQLVEKNKKLFMWGKNINPVENASHNPFDKEHSMEIELPLLHYYMPDATVLPVIIGHGLSQKQCEEIAKALKPFINEETGLVISSDFIHYGSTYNFLPFQGKTCLLDRIRAMTSEVMQPIFKHSFTEFQIALKKTKANVCGYELISILLALLADAQFKKLAPYLVGYGTSSDGKLNEKEISKGTVSYGTIAFAKGSKKDIPLLTDYEKRSLLEYARNSIQQRFAKKCGAELLTPLLSPGLQQQCGTFVTLTDAKGVLRGCIGTVMPRESLYVAVRDNAQSAAFNDRRFAPLSLIELKDLKVEISLLSVPRETSQEKVTLGDGVIFEKDGQSALFLPEVALEQGWDLLTMFSQLAKKAGLSSSAWKDAKAKFKVFRTEKIKL